MSILSQTLTEQREKLEQLRLICNDVIVRAYIASPDAVHPSIEVDTQEDLDAAIAYAKNLK